MLSLGCIGNMQIHATDKYELQGNIYTYQLTTVIKKPTSNVSENSITHITDNINSNGNLKLAIISQIDNVSSEETYYLNVTSDGSIEKAISGSALIPEIQPELIPIVKQPGKSIGLDDTWDFHFNRSDSYFIDNYFVEYTVSGNTIYACVDFEEISIDAGDFNCTVVTTNTNYVLDAHYIIDNKSISSKTTGSTQGKSWIDIDTGFVVKSEYTIDKATITDFSNAYAEIGIGDAYRETPYNSYVTSKLLSINQIEEIR
jgi:hypothetical protein